MIFLFILLNQGACLPHNFFKVAHQCQPIEPFCYLWVAVSSGVKDEDDGNDDSSFPEGSSSLKVELLASLYTLGHGISLFPLRCLYFIRRKVYFFEVVSCTSNIKHIKHSGVHLAEQCFIYKWKIIIIKSSFNIAFLSCCLLISVNHFLYKSVKMLPHHTAWLKQNVDDFFYGFPMVDFIFKWR